MPVTNQDIDEARRRMRVAAGGHEPYAPAVYGEAQKVCIERLEAALSACEADYAEAVRALARLSRYFGADDEDATEQAITSNQMHAVLSTPHARRVMEVKP